jgi:hypothetical protein
MSAAGDERGSLLPAPLLVVGGLSLSIPLAALAANGSTMRYTGDDYCYAGLFTQRGFWGTLGSTYLGPAPFHGNRYSLTFVSGLADSIGPAANAVLPALALLLWIAGLALLFRRVPPPRPRLLPAILAAQSIALYSLALAPQPEQSLYWRSGMLPYLAPLVLSGFLGSAVLSAAARARPTSAPLLLAGLLAWVGAGFSETAAALQMAVLVLLLAAAWNAKRPGDLRFPGAAPALGAALAGTALGVLLLWISPSNASRLADLDVTRDPLAVARMSFWHAYLYLHGLPFRFALPCAAIGLSFFCWTALAGRPQREGIGRRTLLGGLILGAVWFALTAAVMAPSAYAQSSYPVGRALIAAGYLSAIGLAGLGALAGRWVAAQLTGAGGQATARTGGRVAALSVLFVLSVTAYPLLAARTAVAEYPRYRRWADFWDDRDRQIRAARRAGVRQLEVVLLDKIIPGVAELQPDPNFWYNNCAEWRYDMRRISASLPGWDD